MEIPSAKKLSDQVKDAYNKNCLAFDTWFGLFTRVIKFRDQAIIEKCKEAIDLSGWANRDNLV